MTRSTRPTPTTLLRLTRFGRSALLALALSGVLGAVGPGSGAGAGFGAEASWFTAGLPSASAAEAKQSAWVPGTVVPDAELKQFPIGDWFKAAPIPDDVFARMKGKSFKADCTWLSQLKTIFCYYSLPLATRGCRNINLICF